MSFGWFRVLIFVYLQGLIESVPLFLAGNFVKSRERSGEGACAEGNIRPVEIHELVEKLIAVYAIHVLQKCIAGNIAAFS